MLPETAKTLGPGDEVVFNAQGGGYANLAPTKMLLKSGTKAVVDGLTTLPVPNMKLSTIEMVDHVALKFDGGVLFAFTYKELEVGFDLGKKKPAE